jgi:hypothetical protein
MFYVVADLTPTASDHLPISFMLGEKLRTGQTNNMMDELRESLV